MNTPDYKDLEKEPESETVRRLRWGRWILALAVLAVLVTVPLLWMLRTSLAERALSQWCESRNLVCEGRITRLGSDGGIMEDLVVRSGQDVPVEADMVRVGLDWHGLDFSVTGIEITSPVLRGTLDEQGLHFHGLERLGGGTGGSGQLPAVTVTDGRILLQTSAGEIAGSGTLDGRFPDTGALSLSFDPVSLDGPDGTLVWTEGTLNVTAREGRMEGELFLDIERADIRGVHVRETNVSALLNTPGDGGGETQLVWSAAAASGSWAGYGLEHARSNGRAILTRLPDMSIEGLLGALEKASVELEAGRVVSDPLSGSALRFEADLTGREGLVSGPVLFELAQARLPQGEAGSVRMTGKVRYREGEPPGLTGDAAVVSARLASQLRAKVTEPVRFPGMLSDHAAALRAALERALDGFDMQGGFSVARGEDGWAIGLTGPVRMEAVSGLQVAVDVPAGAEWLAWSADERSVRGSIDVSGGGLPAVHADITEFVLTGEGMRLKAEDVDIAPWRAGARTISADLVSLSYDSRGAHVRAGLRGRLGLAGQVSGLDLAATSLTGALSIEENGRGWQVESPDRTCLRLDTQGLKFGAVAVLPAGTEVCPENGAFLRPGGAGLEGAARLGTLVLPLELSSGGGALTLAGARVDWASSEGVTLSAVADTLSLPLTISEKTLSIEAGLPRIGVSTRPGAAPRISARMEGAEFGGTLIPAIMSAERFSFDGASGREGLGGHIRAEGVSIRDYRDDPLYQPLGADLTAELTGSHLHMTGPLRLAQGGITVADSEVQIDLQSLDGTAQLVSRRLAFQPGGLQPLLLSDRLRGVFTDARGDLSARADLVIEGGRVSGTGEVTVADFGFQTNRLGRVRGVNGKVVFDDLLNLTTAPDQVITVGSLNPGVPLVNGRIVFRLDDGKTLAVDSAAFPFAGGALALSPVDWVLGGETQHLEVTAQGIELAALVEVLKLPNTEASGTVAGRFPIDVDGTKILVRDARLRADADGGRIAYQGPVSDAAAAGESGARMAFEALKDFDFTVLELGLDGDVADRMTVSVLLQGVSRRGIPYGPDGQVVTGQPFEFNIAVTSALADLFRNAQYYTSQKYLTDVIVKEVQDSREKDDQRE